MLVKQAMQDQMRETAKLRSQIHAEGLNEFFRGMNKEKLNHYTPFWQLFMGHPDTPEEVEKVLRFIAHGRGEASEIASSLGLGQVIGTSVLSGVSNLLAPVNQQILAAAPFTLLDPSMAAAAVVQGWLAPGSGEEEAKKSGVSSERFSILRHLAENPPSFDVALVLWRRGLVNEQTVRNIAKQGGINEAYLPELLELKREHLAPADAALATLRGIITEAEGADIAAVDGYTASDFRVLVENTGEPPGLMQLLEAYRRDFINDERLRKGIRQSRVRDEWADVVEKLRFTPASTSDALKAVIQGHISSDEGKVIAEQNGQRPEDWDWLVATEGNPPGNMQMITLLRRKKISQEDTEQAIRESRVKDKYIPAVIDLKRVIPAMYLIKMMVERGAMDPTTAERLLEESGYEPQVCKQIVHAATTGTVTKEKQLAKTEVTELYHDGAITRDHAIELLGKLGYTKDNCEFILALIELKRERRILEAGISPIRSAYVKRHITEAQASADLDKIRVPANQKAYLLALWAIERTASTKELTEAQVVRANTLGLMDDSAAESRLMGIGYSHEDAQILLDLEKGRTVPAP